jgi:hypothetical protein
MVLFITFGRVEPLLGNDREMGRFPQQQTRMLRSSLLLCFLCGPCRYVISKGQGYSLVRYDYITKLCRKQAEVIQTHENEHVHGIGQGEARHRKYKRLKLGGGQAYDRSSD